MTTIIAFNANAFTDAKLLAWAKADSATTQIHRVDKLDLHPKKWVNGELTNIDKTSTIMPSCVFLNGVVGDYYSFRIDLTTLLGLSYKNEKQMKTGINFRLAKSAFDASFNEAISSFIANFGKFCQWRGSEQVWRDLVPFTSQFVQKAYPAEKPPSMYFNKETAFNGTMLSMPKLTKTGVQLPDWLTSSFINSCITPGFLFDSFVLVYDEEESKITVNGTDITIIQKVAKAFSYQKMVVQTFGQGGALLDNDTSLYADTYMAPEEESLAPVDIKPTIVKIGGKQYIKEGDKYYAIA